jgi:hypothetical protein
MHQVDAVPEAAAEPRWLEEVHLELPYIPDFLLEEMWIWLAPSLASPQAAYHELVGESEKTWKSYYYTKKGWSFIHADQRPAEGPFRAPLARTHLRIQEPGRIFQPRPVLKLSEDGPAIPIVSLDKRRPLNPWKPNYIQALNFIRKYEWQTEQPRSVQHAIWEIEECGQIAGSRSWRNAELILRDLDSRELRLALVDIFYNRPEDYPLGSEVYLSCLGSSGPDGFAELLELAKHPIARKRKVVANTLGELRKQEGLSTLLELLDDEDPDVRNAALRAVGKVGIAPDHAAAARVRAYLEAPEMKHRVWAAQALRRGGDAEHEKYLLALVKEEPRLLTDMGELGDVLADLHLTESVPYLIQRLKHSKSEFRADAAEALGKLTGLNLEYQSLDNPEQQHSTIKAYTRWWEQKKKERRLGRDGE